MLTNENIANHFKLLKSALIVLTLLFCLTGIVVVFDYQTTSHNRMDEVFQHYSRLKASHPVDSNQSTWFRIEQFQRLFFPDYQINAIDPESFILVENEDWPLILYYTDEFYSNPKFNSLRNLRAMKCEWRCRYTTDRRKWNQSRTVIIREQFPSGDYPPHASADQRILIEFPEAPGRDPVRNGLEKIPKNFINLTFGYMRVFDFHKPYDAMFKKRATVQEWRRIQRLLAQKQKGAFVVSSNCVSDSKRELYIEELQKFFPIDTFGQCGNNPACDSDCMKQNLLDYRFYIAFENNVCEDYFTEKYFHIKDLIVPIVLKREIYKGKVPRNSYIAVDQFDTMQQLASHLHYLSQNQTAYLQYFEWTKHFGLGKPGLYSKQYCKVCENAYNTEFHKVYEDIADFFGPERWCDNELVPRLLHSQLYNDTERY